MTTGTTNDDRRYQLYDSNGNLATVGPTWFRQWTGGDKHTPRSPYSPVVIFDHRNNKWRNYKARSKPPKRASNEEHPYSVYASYLNKSFFRNHQVVFPYSDYTGPVGGGLAPGGLGDNWTALDQYSLIGKLRDKVGGSDFNLAVFLAEGNEALRMIGDTAIKLSKGITYARHGDFVNVFRVLFGNRVEPPKRFKFRVPDREIASRWLELQYGWKPLLSDIHGGAEFLAHQLNVPLQQVTRVSRQRVVSLDSPPIGGAYSRYVNYGLFVRSSIKAIISEVNVPQLVGLTDPLSVIWEKTPWSFVADWAIPIGSWLQSRGLQQALTGTFVQTTKNWYEGKGIRSIDPDRVYEIAPDPRVTLWARETRLVRTVSSSLNVPYPTVKPLGKVASWGHAANGIALLTQVFGKKLYGKRPSGFYGDGPGS